MIRVEQHPAAVGAGSDMPAVVLSDDANLASRPVHPAQPVRPNGKHEIACRAEKRLVYNELIVTVLIKTLEAGAIASYTVHARCRVAGELDPLVIQRMKLRMNHRA